MATDPHSLGQLCVERGLLTRAQLDLCLQVQQRAGNYKRLGEVLMNEGYLTGTALAQMLNVQEAQRRSVPAGEETPTGPLPTSELGWLLKETRAYGAHAIILGPGRPPAFHLCGRTELLQGPPLHEDQIIDMMAEALPEEVLDDFAQLGTAQATVEATVEVDCFPRVRIALYRHTRGVCAVLRPQTPRSTDLANLGLPAGAERLAEARDGLVLLTGPAGSGRATTLSSLIDAINGRRACHIVALERPARIQVQEKKARITSREVGRDAASFAAALRGALRMDADVIALSEMDEADTAAAAVDAAANGRLVIGLMHTNGTCETIQRLLDGSATKAVLAGCLRGIVTQHLIPALDGSAPVIAAELLLSTPGIANLIREDRIDQISNILHMSRSEGMAGLDDALTRLYRKGRIQISDAIARATDPEKIKKTLATRPETSRVGH